MDEMFQGAANTTAGMGVHETYHDLDGVRLQIHVLIQQDEIIAVRLEEVTQARIEGLSEIDILLVIIMDEHLNREALGLEMCQAAVQLVLFLIKRDNDRDHPDSLS